MPGKTTAAKAKPAAKRSVTRAYTVVRVNGDSLTVLDPEVIARHQDEAMDKVALTLQPENRQGRIGAFLLGSYREHDLNTSQEWQTETKKVAPSFAASNGSPPPAAD